MLQKHPAQYAAVLALLAGSVAIPGLLRTDHSGAPPSPPQAADTASIASGRFHLRYAIEGTGTPTIVVGSALYYPRAFSKNLRRYLRMVFMDHRGFAASPGPADTTAFALDTLIDDIERVRKALASDGSQS